MTVMQIQSAPGTFFVNSDTNKKQLYHVSLLPGKLNGACTCPQFRMRLKKLLKTGEAPMRCKHIIAARNWYLDKMLTQLGDMILDK